MAKKRHNGFASVALKGGFGKKYNRDRYSGELASSAGRLGPKQVDMKDVGSIGVFKTEVEMKEGIIKDGVINDFPQHLSEVVSSSSTGQACIQRIKEFVTGQSLGTERLDQMEVSPGTTFWKMHQALASDWAYLRRVAIKVVYSKSNVPLYFQHIPAKWVRWGLPDSGGDMTYVAVNPLFGTRHQKQADSRYYFTFNDNPEVVRKQREYCAHHGLKHAQVLFLNEANEEHPIYSRPAYFASENDFRTEAGISQFHERNLDNNFLLSAMVTILDADANSKLLDEDGDAQSEKARAFVEELHNMYAGAEVAGSIMVQTVKDMADKAHIEQFPNNIFDGSFESLRQSTRDTIVISCQVPRILANIETAGKLGDSKEIRNAITLLNQGTKGARKSLEQAYRRLLGAKYPEAIKELDIQPLSVSLELGSEEFKVLSRKDQLVYISDTFDRNLEELAEIIKAEEEQADQLAKARLRRSPKGAEMMVSLACKVQAGEVKRRTAIEVLKMSLGLSEDQAEKIIDL